jgi:hypothetical protein
LGGIAAVGLRLFEYQHVLVSINPIFQGNVTPLLAFIKFTT